MVCVESLVTARIKLSVFVACLGSVIFKGEEDLPGPTFIDNTRIDP